MAEIFVGRARELEELGALLAQVRQGHGRLTLLTGEPGVGKSRLADEVARRAEVEGCATAWGRTWEGAGTPAYWPWTQVLRALTSVPELRPAIADRQLEALMDPAAALSNAPDTEQARFQLFDRIASALHRAARLRPLLLIFDDVHSADAATLELLQFVARGLDAAPVLILVAARDTAFAADDERLALLAQVGREARHLPLEGLGREALREWVAHEGQPIAVDRLLTATEGNPLFVAELLAWARKRPDAAWTADQMPLGVREAIRGHLTLLSEATLRLLETASVLGRELAPSALKAIAAESEYAALGQALASGVLRDVGDERLRFSHMLMRDELYARLPDARRAELHRAASAASPTRAVAAHHALLGARAEDAAAVLKTVQGAMGEASSRLAHEDAARLGKRALETLERHLGRAEVCALRVAIAEALVSAGDVSAGQAEAERAAAMAAELGAPELLARAALTRASELDFVRAHAAERWLRRALEALPDEDSSLRAQVMARLSAAVTNSPSEMAESYRLRSDAVAMARRLGDEKVLFAALYNASGMFPEELQPQERFARYAEIVDLAERVGAVGRIVPVLMWHVVSWLELGQPDGAQAAADRVEALLAPYPQPRYRWQLPLVRAVLAAIAGRFDEADQLSRESYDLSRAHGLAEGQAMYAIYAGSLAYIRGDDAGLLELPSIEDLFRGLPVIDFFSTLWNAPRGRVDQVRTSFALLKTMPVEEVTGAAGLGWACIRAGTKEYAEFFYGLAAKLPQQNLLFFAPGGFGCPGPLPMLLGQLAAMTGRNEEAGRCFARASAIARDIRSPPFIAQAELGWAEVLAPAEPAAAVEHARVAYEQASAVGLSALATRADALLSLRTHKPPATQVVERTLVLRRDGELWALEVSERRLTLRDSKGMAYLQALLLAPHASIHVLELAASALSRNDPPLLSGNGPGRDRECG